MELQKQQQNLLALLMKECELYRYIPASEVQQKREKKCFIDGLMTACRVVGISYEELEQVIALMPKQDKFKDLDEQLSIPAYIRNNVTIHR